MLRAVKSGYPPKVMVFVDDEPLSAVVTNFETLIVSSKSMGSKRSKRVSGKRDAPHEKQKEQTKQVVEGTKGLGDVMSTIGEDLANAVSNPDVTATTKAFRKQLKSALRQREEERLAGQRVEAALLGNYEFLPPTAHRLDGLTTSFRIKFKISARKWREEEYLVMPMPLLKVVILSILKVVMTSSNL